MNNIIKPPYDHLLKIIVVGDSGVGKTTILNAYAKTVSGQVQPTAGIDFITKFISVDNSVSKVQIWDTAGQERFRSIIKSYYKKSSCVIIMYDCTDRKSFDNVKHWYDSILSDVEENILVVLARNKCDLEGDYKTVPRSEELGIVD